MLSPLFLSLSRYWKLLYFSQTHSLSMKMNTSLCRHTTQIISRILNIIRILSRFIIISLTHAKQYIHGFRRGCVKIALSIAATPLKDGNIYCSFAPRTHTHYCCFLEAAVPYESSWAFIYIEKNMAIKFEPITVWTHSVYFTCQTPNAFDYGIQAAALYVCNKVITWSQALNWLPWMPHFRIIRDNLIRNIDSVSPTTHRAINNKTYPIDCILSKEASKKPIF